MKHFIFIALFLLINISVYAQVKTEISYNSKDKKMTLTITNLFSETIFLSPIHPESQSMEATTWYRISWKNSNQDTLYTYSRYIDEVKSFAVPSKKTRTVSLNLKSSKISVRTISIFLHIGGRLKGEEWVGEDITKTYEY